MHRKALPFKPPWDKVPNHCSRLTCHSSLLPHSLLKTCLFELKRTQLPTRDLCPSFFPPFSIHISKVTHNRVYGSNTNLPSWKLPFLPLNYPPTGPPVLGLGKYHSHVSSLPYISGEHPRTGLSPSQPPPSCPATESLAYPRRLEDTKKFYKLEKSRKTKSSEVTVCYLTIYAKPKDA